MLPPQVPIAPPFTLANAAEMARRATASRLRKAAAQRERLAFLETEVARLTSLQREPIVADASEPSDVARTRILKQIAALNTRIDGLLADGHPRAIECLTRAIGYLREQERILAGRPLPGVLKPRSQRNPAAASFDELEPPRAIAS